MKDWFVVNAENMVAVAEMFGRDGFGFPSPRCFGRPIRSFDLSLRSKKVHKGIQWKLVFNKIASFLF